MSTLANSEDPYEMHIIHPNIYCIKKVQVTKFIIYPYHANIFFVKIVDCFLKGTAIFMKNVHKIKRLYQSMYFNP